MEVNLLLFQFLYWIELYTLIGSDTYATDFVDMTHKKLDSVWHFSRMRILVSRLLLACGIISDAFRCQDWTKRSSMTSAALV